MTSYIDVSFERTDRNPSIESAIHRWVARFEAMRFAIQRATAAIEPAGRNRTTVRLTLVLADGTTRTAATTHADPYVAVSDAFRVVRQQLLAGPPVVKPDLRATAD
jgi:ribosome-associated translation inhibitor RaiA